jgi:hypothetical protein
VTVVMAARLVLVLVRHVSCEGRQAMNDLGGNSLHKTLEDT